MWPRARSRAPVSSWVSASMRLVRSPAATVSAACTAARIGRVMPRVSIHENSAPSSTAPAVRPAMIIWPRVAVASMPAAVAAMCVRCIATSSLIDSW